MIKYIVLEIQNDNNFQPSLCEYLGKTGFETEEQAKNVVYESIASYLKSNSMTEKDLNKLHCTDDFSGYKGYSLCHNDNNGCFHNAQWRIIRIQV